MVFAADFVKIRGVVVSEIDNPQIQVLAKLLYHLLNVGVKAGQNDNSVSLAVVVAPGELNAFQNSDPDLSEGGIRRLHLEELLDKGLVVPQKLELSLGQRVVGRRRRKHPVRTLQDAFFDVFWYHAVIESLPDVKVLRIVVLDFLLEMFRESLQIVLIHWESSRVLERSLDRRYDAVGPSTEVALSAEIRILLPSHAQLVLEYDPLIFDTIHLSDSFGLLWKN